MAGPVPAGPRHLARLWEASLQRLGEHPALWFEGVSYGTGELVDRAAGVAAGLRRLGVQPGDRVAVLMANCPEVSITYHAIWRAGAAAAPVIFLVTPPELRRILVDSGATVLVTTAEWVPKATEAMAGLAVTLVVLGAGTDQGEPGGPQQAVPGAVDFRELAAEEPGSIVDRADGDLAALMFTGGTTGRSKGVPLTHENLWLAGWAARQVSYVPGLTRAMTALPLSHSYGLLVTVGALHAVEPGLAVLMRWFEPARWLELAVRHRIQVSAVVPSMIAALLAQPLEDHDLSELRNVFSGAAPLPPALAREFERRVPSVQLLEGYGLTESGAVATASPPGRRRLGTVGLALPGVELRIVDDLGAPLPPGADGEILVRGPSVMTGYWQDPETPGTDADGWLATGDIGHLDADGYLTVVDRKKDLVIRGGYNVYPRDVEDVLLQHPAVTGAAVVGRPDPRLGEEVLAFVAVDPAGAVTGEALIQFAKQRLAATKYPREIRVIDAIPLTPVGKVDRKQLRRLVTDPAGDGS